MGLFAVQRYEKKITIVSFRTIFVSFGNLPEREIYVLLQLEYLFNECE